MKTQIVRLESHDDFISARDKMGWNQTGWILLVYPQEGHILNRRLDLILLQRHSQALGAQLAIVTGDTDARYFAKKVGVPVYKSIHRAQKSHWRENRGAIRKNKRFRQTEKPHPDLDALRRAAHPKTPAFLTHPGTRLVFFLLGVLALLSIAAVLVPQADIYLQPVYQTQTIAINVQAKPGLDNIHISGSIPAGRVTVIVEGRGSAEATGISRVPREYAQGRIQFTNLTDQSILIPSGTVVRTLGEPAVRFAVLKDARLPAGVGETVTVSVQAVEPGEDGNLEPGSLIAIESELGASTTATNPYQTWGGEDSILSRATPYNREQLFQNLVAELEKTALDELTGSISAGDILFTETISISQIIEQRYDPEGDLPSDQISLNLRIEFEALSVTESDLLQLAEVALDASLPEMFVPQPGTLNISLKTQPRTDAQGITRMQVQAQRQIKSKLSAAQAINQSLGLTPAMAAEKLKTGLPISGAPQIKISPNWWPRLPILPFRFEVTAE